MPKVNRRDFIATTAAAGVVAATARPFASSGPEVIVQSNSRSSSASSSRPVVVASDNGNRYKNGGTKTCVELAFEQMTSGTDVLDALIAGVNIVELDPLDTSVGYGGLPNADGIVQLKAQYGIDNTVGTPTGVVNQWTAVDPTTADAWSRVLALRLVVVARSGQMERPTDPVTKQIITGACNTTTSPPNSMLGAIDVSADPNWQCYRYRVFETVVPLRNQIWAPLP